MTSEFRVGLLGHGTVGAAFARAARASAPTRSSAITGLRPEISGVLTRSRGDFDDDPRAQRPDRRADRRHRAGARLRAARDARRQARRHRQQAAALPARRGAVGGRARARRAAALRGRGGRRRAGHPRAAGVARRRARRARPRDRQRHDELHPHRDGAHRRRPTRRRSREAQELGYAEADPTDDVDRQGRRGQDGDPRAARVRRRRSTSTRSATRASSTSPPTTSPTRSELGLALKLIGTAERVDGGIAVRVHPAFLYAGPPAGVASTAPFNAVTIESDAITEITLSGPGRRRPADRERGARRRDLGDDPAARSTPPRRPRRCRSSTDVESAFYLHLEVADRPGVLAQVAEILGMQGASIKSVVQKGLGDNARLVMVLHPLLESRFYARAAADRRSSTSCAPPPRAIRVIEEEFSEPRRPDRALPRPAAVRAGRPGRHARRGLDAARARRRALSERVGAEVWLKLEGANPTGSFKDRGMTVRGVAPPCARAPRR